jgi:aminoglycoside phosphotransferase family enzyme/predicted kinase
LSNDVYLGVVPIVRDLAGVHSLDLRRTDDGRGQRSADEAPLNRKERNADESNTVVDYCVHMRRLSDDDRLDHLLEQGALLPAQVRDLAAHLARFHASVTTDATIAEYGDVATIRRNVEENFAQTKAHLGEFLTPDEVRELERSQLGFLERNAALLEQRIAEGRIRDGHGDLRLEHVYRAAEGFQILDCIEFNDRFRYADTCADLAFLSMDLRHWERADLAELLLAAYAEESGDFELYALANFYESYRAMVRAKVNLFVAVNSECPLERRERAGQETKRYLTQALSSSRSRPVGEVIAVGGMIGAGKTHTCSLLAQWFTCPVVSSDRVRKRRLAVNEYTPLHAPSFTGAYAPNVTRETYDALFRAARCIANTGRTVILDASFRSKEERGRLREWCDEMGARLSFVECTAPSAVLRERLRQRAKGPSVSDGREDIFDAFAASYEAPDELPASHRMSLDTTLPRAEQSQQLQHFVHRLQQS